MHAPICEFFIAFAQFFYTRPPPVVWELVDIAGWAGVHYYLEVDGGWMDERNA